MMPKELRNCKLAYMTNGTNEHQLETEQRKSLPLYKKQLAALAAILIAGAGLFLLGSSQQKATFSDDQQNCETASIRKAFESAQLSPILNCTASEISVDGSPALLLSIEHGPGTDCKPPCKPEQYTGLLMNGKITDFEPQPDLSSATADYLGPWCAITAHSLKHASDASTAIVTLEGQLRWKFRFNGFSNQEAIKELSDHSVLLHAIPNPQYCTYNGELLVIQTESGSAVKLDISGLKTDTQPLAAISQKTPIELIAVCKGTANEAECIAQIAYGTKDYRICNNAAKPGVCLAELAERTRNPAVCGIVIKDEEKDACSKQVQKVIAERTKRGLATETVDLRLNPIPDQYITETYTNPFYHFTLAIPQYWSPAQENQFRTVLLNRTATSVNNKFSVFHDDSFIDIVTNPKDCQETRAYGASVWGANFQERIACKPGFLIRYGYGSKVRDPESERKTLEAIVNSFAAKPLQ